MRRSLTGAAITAALILLSAPAAQASFVSLQPSPNYRIPPRSSVQYTAATDETNAVTVTNGAGNALVIADPGAIITTNTPTTCVVSADQHSVTCTPAAGELTPTLTGFTFFGTGGVQLGNGDDTFTDSAAIPAENDAQFCSSPEPETCSENDVFYPVFVSGGSGNDVLNGNDNQEAFGSSNVNSNDPDDPDDDADSAFSDLGNDTYNGGGGDDIIQDVDQTFQTPTFRRTGGGDDRLVGGPGADDLFGGDGNDTLLGEDGEDVLAGELGTDAMDGGNGFDAVQYFALARFDADGDGVNIKGTDPGVAVTLNAAATSAGNGADGENDSLTNVEDVGGSQASDTLVGSAVSNVLSGNGGNDVITGNAGNDNLGGGDGADTINAQDAEVDAVDCGGSLDTDTANVDNIDQVRGCGRATVATVVVPPVPPVIVRNPLDTVKAKFTRFKVAKKMKAKTLRRKGKISGSFTANEPVVAEAEAEAKAGKRAFRTTVGYVSLGKKKRVLAANKRTKVTVTVKKSLRKRFKKGKKLRLTVRLTDAGNNVTTRKATIRLT